MYNNPKNIIIIGPAHPLRPGGITTFNERLCKALNDAGYQCSIWSFSLQYPSILFPGTSQYTDGPAPANLRIVTAINSINPFNWWRVGNRIKKEKPDLVIVRFWIPFMGLCLGSILRRIRTNRHTQIVCIADNIIPHESRPGDKWLTQYFVKPVDRFLVMSQQVMNDLQRFSQKPAKLITHPLYDNFGEAVPNAEARQWLRTNQLFTINSHDKVLLFFGLIRHYKGLDLLLEAMTLVKDQSIKLIIAGEYYDDPAKYQEWWQHPLLTNRLLLHTRFVSNEEVKYFVCAADCVIQPYRQATQSGVTPVAYHFNIPMIVTNVGGLPEMVPNDIAGLVCDANAESIANAIDAYFLKGKSYFLPGLANEKKQLSWEVLVEQITK